MLLEKTAGKSHVRDLEILRIFCGPAWRHKSTKTKFEFQFSQPERRIFMKEQAAESKQLQNELKEALHDINYEED